jgi:hypothetical protein
MVGELAQTLLQRLKGFLALRQDAAGENRGEDLERIAEFLTLDAEAMDLVRIPKPAIRPCKESFRERLEPPPGIRPKCLSPAVLGEGIDKPFDVARPVAAEQSLVHVMNGPAGGGSLPRQHRHQPPAGVRTCGHRLTFHGDANWFRMALVHALTAESLGEHVEIAGVARGSTDPS